MNPGDPNVLLVESVAQALGSLNERVVYLGGCAVGLLITDHARPPVRATVDVDVIVEVASRADYYAMAADLREHGFVEDYESKVLCRWRLGNLQVDIIPTDPKILGFSNRWLQQAVDTASSVALPSGRVIRLITGPLLVATKLEAFYSRGNGDFRASHDIEDIVNLLDGRAELAVEIVDSGDNLRGYLREEFDDLLADESFTDALAGHLGPGSTDQARLEILIEQLRHLAGI